MNHHSELLNFLIEKFKLTSYLEIGTFNRDHNFNKIRAEKKLCVDPDPNAKADFQITSDDFFKYLNLLESGTDNWQRFDLIFIDGLHHADQVKMDFENALFRLNNEGFIVMHDCNPHKESITHVPRDSREWCGDVYKFACTLGCYEDIRFNTLDFDYGCTVVWKVPGVKAKFSDLKEITWEYFQESKDNLLQLMPVEKFVSICNHYNMFEFNQPV